MLWKLTCKTETATDFLKLADKFLEKEAQETVYALMHTLKNPYPSLFTSPFFILPFPLLALSGRSDYVSETCHLVRTLFGLVGRIFDKASRHMNF